MFKLLTEKGRKLVMREYTLRRTIIIISALSLVLIVGLIGLMPSYLLSNTRLEEVLERTRIMDDLGLGEKQDQEAQTWLVSMNKKLKLLSPKLDADRPSQDFIAKIMEQKTPDIKITTFSWIKTKGKVALSINGLASSRQALISFEDRIIASDHFSEVTLPISDLAKDKDINFQIKFSPK